MKMSLCGHPFCRTKNRNLVSPIAVVNSKIAPRFFCVAFSPLGEVMVDCAEPNPIIVSSTEVPPITYQRLYNAIVSSNNPTSIGRLVQAFSSGSIPLSVHGAQEQDEKMQRPPKHHRDSTYSARNVSYATLNEFRNLDTHEMARIGLFETGKSDEVQCFECTTEHRNWRPGKDPILGQKTDSPDCLFLETHLGVSTLNQYKAQIRSTEKISAREQFSGPSTNGRETGRTCISVFTSSDHIRGPEYQPYSLRLSTFTKWPRSIEQKPEQVAQAGFYYTGLQDVVRCFACDGGLKNWDPEDDPWIEHACWFPQCPFVQKVKGPKFVDLVRRRRGKFDEEEDNVKQPPYFQPLYLETSKLVTKSDTLQRENDDLKSICIKCKVRERNILFLRCTHNCLCQFRAEKCSLCPICYKIINHKIQTQLD